MWRCQPVARTTSSTVAPSGRRSISITFSCFDGRFPSAWGSGSSCFTVHHKRSTKMLSWQRPRPSMLISIRRSRSKLVNSSLVDPPLPSVC